MPLRWRSFICWISRSRGDMQPGPKPCCMGARARRLRRKAPENIELLLVVMMVGLIDLWWCLEGAVSRSSRTAKHVASNGERGAIPQGPWTIPDGRVRWRHACAPAFGRFQTAPTEAGVRFELIWGWGLQSIDSSPLVLCIDRPIDRFEANATPNS